MNQAYRVIFFTSILFLIVSGIGCKKLVDVEPPANKITASNVYNTDATAAAVLTGLYAQMSKTNYGFTASIPNISMWSGLSADEFTLWSGGSLSQFSYYKNALSVNSAGYEFWNNIYPFIFICNSAIEGLNASDQLTPSIKQQLLGESKFMRAFFYFYLVNLYGDVPLVLGTDFKINALLPRNKKDLIYKQIISDLIEAQSMLSDGYVKADATTVYPIASSERVRPNKSVATALLARAYLYNGDYVNAEVQATIVINNSSYYNLTTLGATFLKNSKEAIWQLQPVTNGAITNTADGVTFSLSLAPVGLNSTHPVYLSSSLVNAFELGDNRKTSWTNTFTDASGTYAYPYKYKANANGASVTEYNMILRLAEQFLIRAEARAQQGNLSGAIADLNIIRTRAGLSGTMASTQASLISAIIHEKQVELFTELGHRWFDLKRSKIVDSVMSVATIQKGGTWNSYQQLYPLPLTDLQKDLNLTQNIGYQ